MYHILNTTVHYKLCNGIYSILFQRLVKSSTAHGLLNRPQRHSLRECSDLQCTTKKIFFLRRIMVPIMLILHLRTQSCIKEKFSLIKPSLTELFSNKQMNYLEGEWTQNFERKRRTLVLINYEMLFAVCRVSVFSWLQCHWWQITETWSARMNSELSQL